MKPNNELPRGYYTRTLHLRVHHYCRVKYFCKCLNCRWARLVLRDKLRGKPPVQLLRVWEKHSDGTRDFEPYPRGGLTIVSIFDPDGNEVCSGEALCSLSDNFVYRIGRQIARGRAMIEFRRQRAR